MSTIDMEKKIIDECNELTEPHGIQLKKVKIRNNVKYCLTMDDYEIFCNTNIVDLHKFCQNEADLTLLAATTKNAQSSSK